MIDSRQQKAVELFLDQYDFVKKLAIRFAPERDLTDEIVNDVFLQFTTGVEHWDIGNDIRPILIHLTRTTAIRHWKKSLRHAPETLRRIADKIQQFALEHAENSEDRFDRLRECVERLSSKAKLLVEMFYWKKIPLYRIADKLNVKASTVRQTMVRIRLKLRDCIGSFDENQERNK